MSVRYWIRSLIVAAWMVTPVATWAAQPPVTDAPKSSPLGGTSIYGEAPLPTNQGGQLKLPPLGTPTLAVNEIGTGTVPKSDEVAAIGEVALLPEGQDRNEPWMPTYYAWQASNTFSHPLYFEDIMLERHGHQRCPELTPLFSGARFFATIPALPYLMTLQPPSSQSSTLGHWKPGSGAPCLLQRPPYQHDAVLVEGAAITTGFLVIP